MSHLIENMKKMSRDELVKFADSQGVQCHWKAKPETIIKAVMDRVSNPVKPVEEESAPVIKPIVWVSKDEMEKILAPIKARQPAFEAIYDDETRSVTFRCRGAEDSHSLSTRASILKQKAESVARGRKLLLAHPEFDKGNAGGNSAYTNVVIAG